MGELYHQYDKTFNKTTRLIDMIGVQLSCWSVVCWSVVRRSIPFKYTHIGPTSATCRLCLVMLGTCRLNIGNRTCELLIYDFSLGQ